VGMRLASIVFPEPGGPIIRMLCPPAQATSKARFAVCWHVFEVDRVVLGFIEQRVTIHFNRVDSVTDVYEAGDVNQRAHRIDVNSGQHGGFACIEFRYDQGRDLAGTGFDSDGQRAANASDIAIERQFPDEKAIRNFFLIQAAVSSNDSKRHRQIETRTFFADVGRREIDCDMGKRNVVAAILERGADSVAAFSNGGVGQALQCGNDRRWS
jgi:hypothetical protein